MQTNDDARAIQNTLHWVDKVIIGENLCPFAKKAKYWVYPYEDRASLGLKASFYDSSFDLFNDL